MYKECINCKKTLFLKESASLRDFTKKKFCSLTCWYIAKRNGFYRKDIPCEKKCLMCDSIYYKPRNRSSGDFAKTKFCSIKCSANYRDTGKTIANERARRTAEYKRWRKAIFERDEYTCQICNRRGGDLQADHIKPFIIFPEMRFMMENGRTLCTNCHRETDTFGPKVLRIKPLLV